MLKQSVVKDIRSIVGPANLFTAPEELAVYSYDATRSAALPWAVARPVSADEVSRILVLANREKFPVVPRGAGTGMSGGSVPVKGGVVLSFERMNRILEIDEADRIAVAEPGVITGSLHREAEARGLFYPPDPASSEFCTLGGNVAECAGGLRAVKYGVTRDYVLGLQVVLPDGQVVRTGTRTMKSVAGYDLTRLLIGSEGTLGVVTEITVRLLPLPERVETLAAFFPDAGKALAAASAVSRRGVLPRALEFADRGALRAVESHLQEDFSNGAGAMLLAETDGTAPAAEKEIAAIEDICRAGAAVRVQRAGSRAERDRIWSVRKAISPALYAIKPQKLNEDVVVPLGRIEAIVRDIEAIAARHGLLIVNFGHAGDGNLHVNVMFDEPERAKAEQAVQEVFRAVLGLGGSISGEHGIGTSKMRYLPMEIDAGALSFMKTIKAAMDPNDILNPGKIFLERE